MDNFALLMIMAASFIGGFFASRVYAYLAASSWPISKMHRKYKMIDMHKSKFRLVAIWHGLEGWKTYVKAPYYTVPLYEGLKEIPEVPSHEYKIRYCTNKDDTDIGFYAILE